MQQKLQQQLENAGALTPAEAAQVLACFTPRQCKKYQLLVREGEAVPHAYFVETGLLKLAYTEETGKQHIVSFAWEDWWESDFQAYFTQTPATLSLQCLEDTQVWGLALADYQRLCHDFPPLARFFLQKSTLGTLAAQRRILSLLTTNARQRYDQLLRQQPALLQRVSKTLLAAYLGVSRETLSRLAS